MENLRGKLLLASPEMGDPNFARAVILLVQHGPDGALGLVLNQPTGIAVKDVLAALPEELMIGGDGGPGEDALYRGGPCDGPLMVLHGNPVHGQQQVLDGVYFASERQYLQPALSGAVSPARFFAGYSGWGAGQLEGELAQSAWIVMDTDAQSVLSPESEAGGSDQSAWKHLIRIKKSRELIDGFNPDIVPRDPSMN